MWSPTKRADCHASGSPSRRGTSKRRKRAFFDVPILLWARRSATEQKPSDIASGGPRIEAKRNLTTPEFRGIRQGPGDRTRRLIREQARRLSFEPNEG